MENEKYNPEIHCCRYWYKDFCECVKNGRSQQRIERLETAIDIFEANNIEYEKSNIQSCFKIKTNKGQFITVSYKTWGIFKCQYDGSSKWYDYSKKKFLEIVKK